MAPEEPTRVLKQAQSLTQLALNGKSSHKLSRSDSLPTRISTPTSCRSTAQQNWSEPPFPLRNQRGTLLPRTTPDFLCYGQPVQGPFGKRNMQQVTKAFPFKCRSEVPEHRGITIDQLAQVHRHAFANCKYWKVEANTVCLNDINKWIVKPATKETSCALAEHLASRLLIPALFVSHFWAEPVAQFMECLKLHAATRGLAENISRWICAYTARQHEQLLEGPALTPRVQQVVKHKMLLVVDMVEMATGPHVPFYRLWSAHECAQCLEVPNPLLDVITFHKGRAELVTRDLTRLERTVDRYHLGDGCRGKLRRESTFPLIAVESALSIDIRELATTVTEDRSRLLSFMAPAGRAEQSQNEERFQEVSTALRSLLAIGFLQRVLAQEKPADETGCRRLLSLRTATVRAIRADTQRTSLRLSLAGCPLHDEEVLTLVTQNLPPNLSDLALDFAHTGVTDALLEEVLVVGVPGGVRSLSLDLSGCKQVTDRGVMNFVYKLRSHVTRLILSLAGTSVTAMVAEACNDELAPLREYARRWRLPKSESEKEQRGDTRESRLEALLRTRVTDSVRRRLIAETGSSQDPAAAKYRQQVIAMRQQQLTGAADK